MNDKTQLATKAIRNLGNRLIFNIITLNKIGNKLKINRFKIPPLLIHLTVSIKKFTTKRLEYFVSIGINKFSRNEYMEIFRNISTSTVSRDLKIEVELGILKSIGNKIKQNIPFRITKHLTRLQAKLECLVIVIFHKSKYINEKTNIR